MNTTANINLKVPFAEKDQAKSLGARWNGELKVWYVPPGVDATPFAKWLGDGAAAGSPSTPFKKAPTKSTTTSTISKVSKTSAATVGNMADNMPPQSLDGLTRMSDDADMDAINAKLREAFDTQETDAY